MKYICKPWFYTSCIWRGAELKNVEFHARHETYAGCECLNSGFLANKKCKCAFVLYEDGKLEKLVRGRKRTIPKNSVVRIFRIEPIHKDLIAQ